MMPDPTPPPASIGIEEQIAWMESYADLAWRGARLSETSAMAAAILATLRRVPALERVVEAAAAFADECLALHQPKLANTDADALFEMLCAALAATKEP